MKFSRFRIFPLLMVLGLSASVFVSSCAAGSGDADQGGDDTAMVEGESESNLVDEEVGENPNAEKNEAGGYGVVIDDDDVGTIPALLAEMGDEPAIDGKVRATVSACCQAKGCWMNLEYGEGEEMRVTFRDYGFFVPYDLPGKEVIIQGTAQIDTLSVEYLRHLAEDAGKSAEEIEAINEPSTEVVFVADGVMVI